VVLSALIYCVVSAPFLQESPRWLLASGKPEKAMEMLAGLAKGNGRTLPAEGRGLTLVHFSAQPEPFLTQNTP